jgi:hypothetical protein
METFFAEYVFYIGVDGRIHCICSSFKNNFRDAFVDEDDDSDRDTKEDAISDQSEDRDKSEKGNEKKRDRERGWRKGKHSTSINISGGSSKKNRSGMVHTKSNKDGSGSGSGIASGTTTKKASVGSTRTSGPSRGWGYLNIWEIAEAPQHPEPVSFLTCHMSFASFHIFYIVAVSIFAHENLLFKSALLTFVIVCCFVCDLLSGQAMYL